MAIKKVWIDEGCTACGLCEEICPEVFEQDDEAVVKEGVITAIMRMALKKLLTAVR
jgi:ferredoxin